jgi:hypothetical protein
MEPRAMKGTARRQLDDEAQSHRELGKRFRKATRRKVVVAVVLQGLGIGKEDEAAVVLDGVDE